VTRSRIQAEDVAGIVEVPDLTAAVGGDAARPHDATDQTEEARRLIVLTIHFGVLREGDARKVRRALGRQQHQPACRAFELAGPLEGGPRRMPGDARQVVVIQRCASDALVVDRKAAGLDHVERYLQTGRKADEGPEILGNVGFEQGQAHGVCSTRCSAGVRVAKAPATARAARCRRTPTQGPATNRALKLKALFRL